MKNLVLMLTILVLSFGVNAQEQKVEVKEQKQEVRVKRPAARSGYVYKKKRGTRKKGYRHSTQHKRQNETKKVLR